MDRIARKILFFVISIAIVTPFASRWLTLRKTDGLFIELHARMPENGGWQPDIIQAEVGQPISIRMISDDVVHSFAVGGMEQPALDIMPGEWVETKLVFDQPGKYTFYCTRWCGKNHWRMRGTIEISGGEYAQIEPVTPLFIELRIDIDMPHFAENLPMRDPSAQNGSLLQADLPSFAFSRRTYTTHSPSQLWIRLRSQAGLEKLGDEEIWDLVAWAWQSQTSAQSLQEGQMLFNQNCSACHGENGQGDGVMVWDLPTPSPMTDPAEMSSQQTRPPDFSDPRVLLGASPALLEGKIIRGGMGTGMPYWGPIFTSDEIDSLISYMYSFQINYLEVP
jgi:mono/diheme cytochrome c family protein/plastocyanin